MIPALLIESCNIGESEYLPELQKLGYNVEIVDMDSALLPSFIPALDRYAVGLIGVPKHLSHEIAEKVLPLCDTLFVDLPGFSDADTWKGLVDRYPDKRLCLAKTESYRDLLLRVEDGVTGVTISWSNSDVPKSELVTNWAAYRLIPNLLCMLEMLIGNDILGLEPTRYQQSVSLKVNDDDLVDFAELHYTYKGIDITLVASCGVGVDDRCISFVYNDGVTKDIHVGLETSKLCGDVIECNGSEVYDFHKNLDFYIHRILGLYK